jgi:hypothetical protein
MLASPTAPRDAEVVAAVRRLGSRDAGTLAVVEGLARRLTREHFFQVLDVLERRKSSGKIANDAGLLVKLLKVAVEERARQVQEAKEAALEAIAVERSSVLGVVERAKRENPERYLEAMRDVRGFDVDAYLEAYVADPAERERLRNPARWAA